MLSKRDRENYLEINHKDSPGITPEEAAKAGLNTIPVGAGQVFKTPTYTCSNCQRQIILNPKRTRERFYCPKCDSYHCDDCAVITKVTGICKTMNQRIDEFMCEAVRARKD